MKSFFLKKYISNSFAESEIKFAAPWLGISPNSYKNNISLEISTPKKIF